MDGRKVRHWIEHTASELWNGNKWILPLIIAFITSVLDPFGFSSASDHRSHIVFNRLAAPFYTPEGYNHITVVLVDDAYLLEMGDTYPMSRYNYLDIHSSILQGGPSALFYDFHLPSSRGDQDATALLGYEIASTASNPKGAEFVPNPDGPAVWFSDFGGAEESLNRYDLLGQVETVQVRTTGTPLGEYALCIEPNGTAAPCSAPGARPSPALTLYQSFCSNHDDMTCENVGGEGRIVLQWSRKPEPGRSDCSYDPDSLLGDTMIAARALWRGLFSRGDIDPELAQVCYPFQTVRAADLSGMDETALRSAFEDQVVLIGGFFSDAPDTTISPVHGQIPGVFVHATALDNLLTLGGGVWRAEQKLRGTPFPLELVVELVVLCLSSLFYYLAAARDRRWVAQVKALSEAGKEELDLAKKRLGSALLFLFLGFLALIGIGLVVPLALSMPPTNFYGLLILTVPLLAILTIAAFANWFVVSIEKGGIGYLLKRIGGKFIFMTLLVVGLFILILLKLAG